jgi:hypothetical protein
MPGFESPAAAYSNALEGMMMQREKSALDAAKLQMEQQRHAADMENDREDRALRREQMQMQRDDRLAAKAEKTKVAGEASYVKSRNEMLPMDRPSSEMLKQAEELGDAGRSFPKPAESLPGIAAVPLSIGRSRAFSGEGAPPMAAGGRPGVDPPAEMGLMPSSAAAVRPYVGDATDRLAERKTTQQQARIDAMAPGPERDWYQSKIDGMDPPDAAYPKPPEAPQGVYRESPDRRTIERVGEVPKGSHLIPAPQPKVPKAPSEDFSGTMTPKAFDMYAIGVAKGGPPPPLGNGPIAAKLRIGIGNRAADYNVLTGKFDTDANAPPPDLVAGRADIAADSGALNQLQKNLSAVGAFSYAAKANGQLLEESLSKLPDAGVTFLNKPYRALATAFGSEVTVPFNIVRTSLQTEYSRLINNPNLTGVLTNEARKEIEAGLSPDATIKQLRVALVTFGKESANRENGIKKEMGELRSHLRGGQSVQSGGPGTGGGPGGVVEVKSPKNGKVYKFATQAEADAKVAAAKAAGLW